MLCVMSLGPIDSAAQLRAEAADISAARRKQQDDIDARGFYPDTIHRRLLDGGFYRILQPRMFSIRNVPPNAGW